MPDSKEISVLVVEHASVLRERMAQMLGRAKGIFIVGFAEDGLQGIRLFGRYSPQVVLLDLELPDVNAMALLERMKREQPDCRVIVLSDYSFTELRRRCAKLGATCFFDKNAEFERAVAACQELACDAGVLKT